MSIDSSTSNKFLCLVNKTSGVSSIHATLADLLGTYGGQTIKNLVIDVKVGS